MSSSSFRQTFLKVQQLLIDHEYEFEVKHSSSADVTKVNIAINNNPTDVTKIISHHVGPFEQLRAVIDSEFKRDSGGTFWHGYDNPDDNLLVDITIDWNAYGKLVVCIKELGEAWLRRQGYLEHKAAKSFKAFVQEVKR